MRAHEPSPGAQLMARGAAAEPAPEAVRRGDPVVLERLARQQRARIRRHLSRMIGPRADLEDQVQNVFVEMCRAAGAFRGESLVSTFLGGIAVRVARRAVGGAATARLHQELHPEMPCEAPSPDELAERRQCLRRAEDLLEGITERKRAAFLMWAIEGKSPMEIAACMGASLSATRSRIYYAQQELRMGALSDPCLREFVTRSVA